MVKIFNTKGQILYDIILKTNLFYKEWYLCLLFSPSIEHMQSNNKYTYYLKKTGKVILKVLLFLILFIVLIFVLILLPPVQSFLTNKAEGFLQNKLKTEVQIGEISFGLTGRINLENIYIEDQSKDTLVSGGAIKAHVNLWKLFSSEIEVRDLVLEDITAKIKRELPDTTFNFQFIVDAFVSENAQAPDTAQTAPLKLAIYTIDINNTNLVYKDVITGNDMRVRIGDLSAKIDTLNLETSTFAVPLLEVSNVTAKVVQTKPLLSSESLEKDVADAEVPIDMNLSIGEVNLNKINVQYDNDVSALYSKINIGKLLVSGKQLDLANQIIHLKDFELNNTTASVTLGKSEGSKVVAEEVSKEAAVQSQSNWIFKVDNVSLNDNSIAFDDDNQKKQPYGLDYAHLKADSLTLHAKDLLFNPDSIGIVITRGTMKEQSGFQLNTLQADILYASKQTYIKNLLLKTPGTELKRNLILNYNSFKALTDSPSTIQMDVDILNSHVQVKDILTFVPDLRSQPAFSNPNDVWTFNVQATGNMDRLKVDALQFAGLKNTKINAEGTLSGLMDPNNAGGTLYIRQFQTSKSDLASLSGQNLATLPVNLPEMINASGTVSGGMQRLNTNLDIRSSTGNISLKGSFTDITNPARARYDANISTNSLQLGYILRQQGQIGSLSANMSLKGVGFTPDNINAKMNGVIRSVGFNGYTYNNIALEGEMIKNNFNASINSNDPNAHLNLNASGNLSDNPSFKVNGFIDSVKTMPLNFTTEPFVFRGGVNADIVNADPNNLVADILVTQVLLVSGPQRLPLDTIHVAAGKADSSQYITINSDIANASLRGQYQLTDLGTIIQNTLQPYFSTTNATTIPKVAPYNIAFNADVIYNPVLSSFVPDLTAFDNIHAEGSMATGGSLQANVTAPFIQYGTNELSGLDLRVNTADSGLMVNGNIKHLISGSALNIFNTQINATALNNVINFDLGIEDEKNVKKYFLSGVFSQPTPDNMMISLKPENLMLNYKNWTVPENNSITITNDQILANNFTLQQGLQQLSLQSEEGTGIRPLDVTFSNFKLGTITGFMKSDSMLIDGTINGNVVLKDLMQTPVFTTDLNINDLSFRNDTIGNINAKVASAGKAYEANVTLSGQGNDMQLTGSFEPQENSDILLDLELAINKIQLSSLEGAMAGFIEEAKGSINGNVSINGTTAAPKIVGDINFDTTSITTTLIGGPFRVDDETISVTENGFVFDNFSIRDSVNSALTINGNVETVNFINYGFNIDMNADNFHALNTTKEDNQLYYGDLYVSTNLHIAGTESKPIIDGSLTINESTDFSVVLPQPEPGVVARDGIVVFTDFDAPLSDSLFLAAYDTLNTSDILGFDISTNIEIEKEASFNVIVDAANGDFLNIKGAAQLSAGIDPSGKISLTGQYEIEEGAYQLSFNFLQRKFNIEKGSKIVWLGEPTNAQVDVTAIYVANTAPLDLVDNYISASSTAIRNTYLQKLPFEVMLNIDGELMKPIISFDVVLPTDQNYNVSQDIISNVETRLTQLRQEPSELNKQVFALLLLNRFVGENPFQSSGGGGFNAGSFARQSVSKLLTEQLNQLASGLVNGVDLNFGISSSDDYTTGKRENRTDLNVGLSKQLLNDRLTVTVGSNFALEGPQQSTQKSNNIAGNIAINYQLSKDGKYMIRAYRKNEYEGALDGYIIETGLRFIISLDYEHFREILKSKKSKVEGVDINQNEQK